MLGIIQLPEGVYLSVGMRTSFNAELVKRRLVIANFSKFNMHDIKAASTVSHAWSPTTWKEKPVAQPIDYEDQEHLSEVITRLTNLPDLVPRYEIDQLSLLMLSAARGQIFFIQGGDCAEAFSDVRPDIIKSKQDLLIAQAEILSEGLGMPVVPIGRIAGQYSKPRSSCYETLSCGTVVNAVGHF